MSNEKKESTLKTVKDVTFVYTSVTREQKQLNKDNCLTTLWSSTVGKLRFLLARQYLRA